jgi:hypothetical protein
MKAILHTNPKSGMDFQSPGILRLLPLMFTSLLILAGCDPKSKDVVTSIPNKTDKNAAAVCANTVKANVVALEQAYHYNRFGAVNPHGLMYALERDVVKSSDEDENTGKEEETEQAIALKHNGDDVHYAGHVQLRSDKRPRPLVLRVNEGDCLEVTFTNLLSPQDEGQEIIEDPLSKTKLAVDAEEPKTRMASMHVNGLDYLSPESGKPGIASDGANVGLNPSSLVAPGQTTVYRWQAKKEGGYLFYSMAHPVGGEGDGGQVGLGLFGSVNVEPAGSVWYRSQVTHDQLMAAKTGEKEVAATKVKYPILDYNKLLILDKALDGSNHSAEILHSDLNAVIDLKPDVTQAKSMDELCDKERMHDKSCGQPFREFTAIFHDEITALQAFPELDEDGKLNKVKDGMAINYGASGMGSAVLARRKYDQLSDNPGVICPECKAEEFFLSSWANGDPALLPEYLEDPSNVHHSYMGDNVRFRNLHAGPKETHVFHLHAHQWVQDKNDPQSVYLDSQTISPGASFSYEVHYGGSGNRNFTPGDSIFHCHLYPHFAQGMWELWRTHDVFEDGTYSTDPNKPQDGLNSRNLPDYKIAEGTPNPAIVPIPRTALAPMPSAEFPGYPFYIAGEKGHRPPQPPLDFAKENGQELNGGLPRHLVLAGTTEDGKLAVEDVYKKAGWNCDDLYGCGRSKSNKIASSVHNSSGDDAHYVFARTIKSARIEVLDDNNERVKREHKAMDFHAGKLANAVKLNHAPKEDTAHDWPPHDWSAHDLVPVGYPTCDSAGVCDDPNDSQKRMLFHVNGLLPQSGAPYADPCLTTQSNIPPAMRVYKAAYIQFDMTVNKHGWHDPQARIPVLEEDVLQTLNGKRAPEPLFFRANSGECVEFHATNLIPSNINLDDFQYFTPTDTMGQHIHLVKFDVTSSDGSGNGWNYEDGTFSPDEVRERIIANNEWVEECTKGQHPEGCNNVKSLVPAEHQLFTVGKLKNDPKSKLRGSCDGFANRDKNPEKWDKQHPWCGAQTTVQRWWADPLKSDYYRDASLNFQHCEDAKSEADKQSCDDRTIRTVFTHDHFGPSSHQQHGFYAALVIEPDNSQWQHLDGKPMGGEVWENGSFKKADQKDRNGGVRNDGGPTSYAANILVPKVDAKGPCSIEHSENCSDRTMREFGLAFADFATVYSGKPKAGIPDMPINPPNRKEEELPRAVNFKAIPEPEAIAASDPGTQLINYRNEPIPLRIGKCSGKETNQQCRQYEQKPGDEGDMANVFSSLLHENKSPSPNLKYPEHEKNRTGVTGGMREPGDPATPLLPAFEGDRVQLRLIQGAQEEQHVFTMHGVKWHSQPDSPGSGWTNAQQLGISEHFEFNTSLFQDGRISDYLYYSSATDNLWDGMWGLLRAYPLCVKGDDNKCLPANKAPEFKAWGLNSDNLKPLPTNPIAKAGDVAVSRPVASTCAGAKLAAFDIEAKNGQEIVYNSRYGLVDSNGIRFTNIDQSKNTKRNEPLVLRANAGDCIKISLANNFDTSIKDGMANPQSWSWNMVAPIVDSLNFNQVAMSNRVRLQPKMLFNFVKKSEPEVGINAKKDSGKNDAGEAVLPGKESALLWYAGLDKFDPNQTDPALQHPEIPVEFGVVVLADMADVIKHSSHGAVGALVIEPKDSVSDTSCGDNNKPYMKDTQLMKDICPSNAKLRADDQKIPLFREFVVIYQDDLTMQRGKLALPNLRDADDAEDTGQKAFNYGTEPLWARVGAGSPAIEPDVMMDYDLSQVFSSKKSGDKCGFARLEESVINSNPHSASCDPSTPVFVAKKGVPVRFRVVHPAGHPRQHAFTLFGHNWDHNPWNTDSSALCSPYEQYAEGSQCLTKINNKLQPNKWQSSNLLGAEGGIGPGIQHNILTRAGGDAGIAGDYMYRTQESFMFMGGLWGIFRVCETDPGEDGSCPKL